MYAPIVIFTHKRLNKLKKLLLSLNKNPEVKKSKVYFFIDGPKNSTDKIKTDKIFKYLKKINISKNKKIFYRNNNLGSANSILDGLNYVSSKEKNFIVLEEDLIVSNEFLYFCNTTLNLYNDIKKIWHINCWIFDNLDSNDKFFFSSHMSCWGWASWSDRWHKLKKIRKKKIHFEINKYSKKKFDFLNAGSCLSLLLNYKGKINTWAVYWYYTIFKNNGMTITPFKTLVVNTGFDFKSTNTKINYYSKSIIKQKTINFDLKFKKPDLNQKILNDVKNIYYRKNFLLILSIKIKEILNRL